MSLHPKPILSIIFVIVLFHLYSLNFFLESTKIISISDVSILRQYWGNSVIN